jgi:hypothetical protein
MMDRHSHHVTVEQQSKEAVRVGIERSMKQQVMVCVQLYVLLDR